MEELTNERFGKLRITQINDEPYFIAKDVASALGYANTNDAISRLVADEDKRGSHIPTPGGNQQVTVINESGLYSLILSSKLPQAKEFKHWITKEVLPSIRKHGMYATADTIAKIKEDPNFLIGILQALQEEQAKNKALLEENSKLKPLADLGTMMHDSQGCVDMAEAAKYLENLGYDIGRGRLLELLRKQKLIYKNNFGYNVPRQYAVEQGYFKLKCGAVIKTPKGEIVSQKTVVTPRGLIWLQKLILKNLNYEQDNSI